jgi:sulfatase maturation enzyme AslB (radical SAM superfamily)
MKPVVKCNPNNSCVDCKNNGVNIKLTNKCNCNCAFCIEKGGLVTEEKSVQTLIDATNLLDYNNVLVLGGEPLIYPHLEEYLSGIKNKKIYLTTNGTLLTDDMAEMLSKYLAAINISIHHFTEQKNAEIYQYEKYSFDNIRSAIKIFNKNGIPVRINANLVKGVLDSSNDVTKMIYFAQFMGANSIRFSEIQNCEDLWVDSSKLFNDLPENPYVDGCEKTVYIDGEFKATVKMTCGFVNSLKEKPNDPTRKQTERKVIYPDGEILNGWYNIRNGKATYHGKEQPVKVETVYRERYVNTNSCY